MSDDKRDRDQQILNRLARIEHKVDSIEQTNAFALRAEADKHFETVREIFGRSRRKAQVYLAADGRKNVQQIGEHLDIARQAVTRALSDLADQGMVEIVDTDGSSNIWAKKAVDRSLRISHFLQEEFELDDTGLAQHKT